MKLRSTTTVSPFKARSASRPKGSRKALKVLGTSLVAVLLTTGIVTYSNINNTSLTGAAPCNTREQCSTKIRAAQAEKDRFEKEAQALRAQANSLSNELAVINLEKEAIQSQVNLNQAKYNELTIQIADIEKKIALNRDALGDTLADIQVGDQITPIEMLFGSSNISEYLDLQESRHTVREDLTAKITEIKQLKAQAEKDREEIKVILEDQKNQNALMANRQAEQNRLIAETEGNEARYTSMVHDLQRAISENQRQLDSLPRPGANSGITAGTSATTAYPYKNETNFYAADPWGYYKRQCVSYVAWHLAADNASGAGNTGFAYLGHARNWWNQGKRVAASEVRKGDVIVLLGTSIYGHVMYVEGVNNGIISFTDYNGYGGKLSPGSGTVTAEKATNGAIMKTIRFN